MTATGLLISSAFEADYGDEVDRIAREAGLELEKIVLSPDPDDRLAEELCRRVEIAHFSSDVFPDHSRKFFAAAQGAPNLRWLHVFHAGVDNPVFGRLLDRGVRLTTSSGSTAQPIANSAIGGMLLLARPFLYWLQAQRRHAWEPLSRADSPDDLAGQTMVVVGLGAIGREIARLARAFGIHVVGVRRSPPRDDDPVDELHPPDRLPELMPRAHWLAIACPLTEETRGLISAEMIDRLPRSASVINIARGEIIDEPALIAALHSGRLAGAYLDVFATEPLPPDSPLWDMPNVVISPHNSAASTGNEARTAQYFLRNLRRWAAGAPMENEVRGR